MHRGQSCQSDSMSEDTPRKTKKDERDETTDMEINQREVTYFALILIATVLLGSPSPLVELTPRDCDVEVEGPRDVKSPLKSIRRVTALMIPIPAFIFRGSKVDYTLNGDLAEPTWKRLRLIIRKR